MSDIFWFLLTLPITLLIFFVVQTALSTRRRLKSVNAAAEALSPEAGAQFIHWRTAYDRAYALGGDCRDAMINRAKMLVVLVTGKPICTFVTTSSPLLCQPNHIEGMADEELKKLIEDLEAQNPHKFATG